MQNVPVKWLHRYNLFLAFLDVLLFVVFGLFSFTEASQATVDYWGITPIILAIAGIHLFYVLAIYPFARKSNQWIAHAVSMMIYGVLFASIIETSGNVNLWYRLGFAIWVFLLNLIGPYLAIAAATLAWILFLITFINLVPGADSPTSLNIFVDVIVTIMAIAGWVVLKKYYEKTPDKETLGKLQTEQSKTNFILSSMTDGVVLVNASGKVEYINPAADKMLKWPARNAVGLSSSQVLRFFDLKKQPYSADQEPLTKSRSTKKAVRDNNVLLGTRDGAYLDVSFDATPLLDETGQPTGGIISIFRDVTKERQEEQQKADFINTASHEMRTPVAAIEGYLALAQNPKVANIDERARIYLEKAHSATQHLGQLFQDLLTSSKADDGRLSSHPEVIELGELLDKLTEELRFTAQKKGLEMEYVVGSDSEALDARRTNNKMIRPLYYAYADPDRIIEVLTNLFDNAVKYTIQGKISIGVTGNDKVVQIYVKDTGVGIPTEDLPHLFQKFYRVDNSETRTIGGTGLGLFICKKIVELYKGKIWVTSQPGEGSVFFVNLPRLSSSNARIEQSESSTIT
jgi:PAS domain S-box-containing protein